jgi:hypothetical protein
LVLGSWLRASESAVSQPRGAGLVLRDQPGAGRVLLRFRRVKRRQKIKNRPGMLPGLFFFYGVNGKRDCRDLNRTLRSLLSSQLVALHFFRTSGPTSRGASFLGSWLVWPPRLRPDQAPTHGQPPPRDRTGRRKKAISSIRHRALPRWEYIRIRCNPRGLGDAPRCIRPPLRGWQSSLQRTHDEST